MTYFIDRRLNPKGKSLANRQRFLRRARAQIREAVQKSLKDSGVADIAKDRKIRISTQGTKEPRFRLDSKKAGKRDFVLPGNKEFVPGDQIKKPQQGQGGSGKDAAQSGDGEDDFEFTLREDEILDIFFEDLELPNLVRTALTEVPSQNWKRAGITTTGSPTQINLLRTMRNSFGRRLALRRPKLAEIKALEEEIAVLESQDSAANGEKLLALKTELDRLIARRKWVSYIDPVDVRFNAFSEQPQPTSQAAMFCLMDVSGSMGEREKDLAKRFFVLLHLFLKRRYEKVDIVFIRHTHDAQEVDENTFFYSRQSGGTIVSTALEKMLEIQKQRYTTSDWNIYAAQASDGYTQSGDAKRCVELLESELMPLCQYYAYIEILDEREMEVFSSEDAGAELWRAYRMVAEGWRNFATKRIAKPADIFPVFHELFKKTRGGLMKAAGRTYILGDETGEMHRKCTQLRRNFIALSTLAPKQILEIHPTYPRFAGGEGVKFITPEFVRDCGMSAPLFTESEWTFEALDGVLKAVEDIALNDLKLDIYPNQIEIISTEQMLDAYSALGMPLMYHHWSFGKLFAREESLYRAGHIGLAYEMVINSNPCISYLMEENTMTMQTLVIAHAAFGHNHFFKNNYLFQQWTNAESILEYLAFAKRYIVACEERHGHGEVEAVLDSAHALMDQGVFRYRRPPRPSRARLLEKQRRRAEHAEEDYSELWRTLPASADPPPPERDVWDFDEDEAGGGPKLPEENLLYFLEKYSPSLKSWQREILRIVRHLAQYFYPQRQTKVMNEGCASFVHHHIMHSLYDKGLLTEGAIFEFLASHTAVVFQPEFEDPRYSGINPYALGFGMMTDIKRISEQPTEEDRLWFPSFAGQGDWRGVLKDAWANYRDESFIEQFLSPKLMRDMKLFAMMDDAEAPVITVSAIHDEAGYRRVRSTLARQYDIGEADPNIQVTGANLKGNRKLFLEHRMHRGVPLNAALKAQVMPHIERLWGHEVELEEISDS